MILIILFNTHHQGINETSGMLYIKKEGLSISVITEAKLSLQVNVTDNGLYHSRMSKITTFDIDVSSKAFFLLRQTALIRVV